MPIHKFKKSISISLILTLTSTSIPCNATSLVAVNGSKTNVSTLTPVSKPIIEFKNISKDFSVQSINSKVNDISKTQNNETKLQENPSGTCGQDDDNVTWNLNTNSGELTILGSGNMKNYDDIMPWFDHKDDIKTLIIGNGVASIGSYAFYNCKALKSVTIPESVKNIGRYAFSECSALEYVNFKGIEMPKYGRRVFYNCNFKKISVPDKYKGSTFCGNKVQKDADPGSALTETNNKAFWYDVSILGGIISCTLSIIVCACKLAIASIERARQKHRTSRLNEI